MDVLNEYNSCLKATYFKYVVVGGGIAGVSCAETLSHSFPDDKILLLSASTLVKRVTNLRMITKQLEDFEVEEKPGHVLENECPNIELAYGAMHRLDSVMKTLYLVDGRCYEYKYICLCTGSTPKLIDKTNSNVIGIRDTDTVETFQKRLVNARRILVVGNGGIATEMVYEIEGCEIIWAIKDRSITSTFIDPAAAQFLMNNKKKEKLKEEIPCKRLKYTVAKHMTSEFSNEGDIHGSALGPDWHKHFTFKGKGKSDIHVEYEVEIESIYSIEQFKNLEIIPSNPFDGDTLADSYAVYVKLSNSKIYGCDFIVSATGVLPNTKPFIFENNFIIADDGGVLVNEKMETSINDVYAAGDVCSVDWKQQFWQQMRLWSHARQMGCYAAQCIAAKENKESISLDFCFELFAHITTFFNYKVILLGKYNGQSLGSEYELLVRVTEGEEYIKVVIKDGRMQGAILIGETDLEETFENLILNQMDISMYGEDLLNPDIDIEDYFD